METRRDENDAERYDRNWSELIPERGLACAAVVSVFYVLTWVVLPLSPLRRGTGAA